MSTSRQFICLLLATPLLAGCGNIPRPQFFNPFQRPAPVVYVVPLEQPVETTPAPAAPSGTPQASPVSVRVEEPDRRAPRVIITDERDRLPSLDPTPEIDGNVFEPEPPLSSPRAVAPPPTTVEPRDTGRRVPQPARSEQTRPAPDPEATPGATPGADADEDLRRLRHGQGGGFDVL